MFIKKVFFFVYSECIVLFREELLEKNYLCNWCVEELYVVVSYYISMEFENIKLDVLIILEVIIVIV